MGEGQKVNIRTIYLVLAIVGAIVPYVFFMQHFGASGFGLMEFIGALFVNSAASGFTADLVISSLVFWIAMYRRHGQGKGPNPASFILLNLAIGLSCAFPAYLYVTTDGAPSGTSA
jgi:hypothetical protein